MDAAGWSLPGYAIEELVGLGASAEVWRAREHASGRLVALKRLHDSAIPAERDRLRREAATLAGVRSPYVVGLRTVVTTADGLVAVLDYAAGGSLASLLASRRRLPAGDVASIAAAVANGLADIHAAQVVHGDITPANVLFTGDGRPLIADFGLARRAGRRPADAATAPFADPDVLAGGPPTPASDIYGLGAVCFTALSGHPPYDGDNPADLLIAVHRGERVGSLASDVPAELAEVVEQALSPVADMRPDARSIASRLGALARPTVRITGARVPTEAPPTVALTRPADPLAAPAPAPGPMTESQVLGVGDPLPRPLGAPPLLQPKPLPPRGAPGGAAPDERARARREKARAAQRHRKRAQWPGWRPVAAASCVAVVLAAAVWGGLQWARGSTIRAAAADPLPTASAPAVSSTPSSGASPAAPTDVAAVPRTPASSSPSRDTAPDFAAVLGSLDAVRDAAFARADPSLLAAAYVTGTAAYRADAQRLATLRSAHLHADGLDLALHSVRVVDRRPSLVRLDVVDALPAYRLVDETGRVVAEQRGRDAAHWQVGLQSTPGGWRIATEQRLP